MFESYPLGVMKADFWRYCVLYVHGGIYLDLDTKLVQPIQNWPHLETSQVIIGIENIEHFCQWTLLSVPGHPLFQKIIDTCFKHYLESGNKIVIKDHFVHWYTGPWVFTDAIYDFFNLSSKNYTTF